MKRDLCITSSFSSRAKLRLGNLRQYGIRSPKNQRFFEDDADIGSYAEVSKKYFVIICLLAVISAFKPVYAETTCEYELFRLLDNNYNAAIDLNEFEEMFRFSQGKNSCEETLEAVRKDRKPKHTMGGVNTAPSANFAPPANIAPATNYPPPTNFAPSKYFSDEDMEKAREKAKEEAESSKGQTPYINLE